MSVFHALWHQDRAPPDWALSETLPILKRGKPDNELSSYRSISIVSMVNAGAAGQVVCWRFWAADDIAIIASNMKAQKRMIKFEATCSRAGLSISTKVMHTPAGPAAAQPVLQLSLMAVESVASFVYLGSEVNAAPGCPRYGMPQRDLGSLWYAEQHLADYTSLMYTSLVRPIALSGADMWVLSQERLLDTRERQDTPHFVRLPKR